VQIKIADASSAPLSDNIPLKEKLIYGAAGIADMWSSYTMIRLQVPVFHGDAWAFALFGRYHHGRVPHLGWLQRSDLQLAIG